MKSTSRYTVFTLNDCMKVQMRIRKLRLLRNSFTIRAALNSLKMLGSNGRELPYNQVSTITELPYNEVSTIIDIFEAVHTSRGNDTFR